MKAYIEVSAATETPLNRLEIAITDAKDGRILMPEMLNVLLDAEIAIPSGGEVQADGSGFQPVLFDRDGTPMIACFSDKQRIGEMSAKAPYCLVMSGRNFLRYVPFEYGVVINPGQAIGFEIDPNGLRRLSAEFA